MKHTRHVISLAFAALALFCAEDVTRDTEWQDVPPETRVGTVLDLGGGGGGGLDTNAVQSIIQRNIDTNLLCKVAAAQAMTNGCLQLTGGEMTGELLIGNGIRFTASGYDMDLNSSTLKNVYDFNVINDASFNANVYLGDWSYLKVYRSKQTLPAYAANVATNAAEAVVGEVMDYALTNLTGAAMTLASGQIGNVTLGAGTNKLALSLDFSSNTNRSGDCMLLVFCGAETTLSVGPGQSVDILGTYDKLKAGTNLVMFTRMMMCGTNSVVMVNVKEVK